MEIGPGGVGAFLKRGVEKGYKVTGVELGKENCNRLRKLLGESATIIQTTLQDAGLPKDTFVGGSMRDVFEHIPNPRDFLMELNRVLCMNAPFVIQVPNIDGLIYKIAKEKHTCVFPFEHPNYWSLNSLTKVLQDTGFLIKRVEYSSLDFTLAEINEYLWGESKFTTCFKKKRGRVKKAVHRINAKVLSKFRKIDFSLTPKVANMLKSGSVIRIVVTKASNMPI